MQSKMTPEERKLYGMFDRDEKDVARILSRADKPTVTSEVVEHALTAQYPKVQYVVANVDGTPAWIFTRLIWLLPTRALDKLTQMVLGLD